MDPEIENILGEAGWIAVDETVLETCCGDAVEWDAPECPTCGTRNPLVEGGYI